MTVPAIAILTLNPAVDMTYEIEQLLPDRKVHACATRFDPGGNGINVARALKRLGVGGHSFCIIGGEIGTLLERLLRSEIETLTIERVEGETRINGTAIEHHPSAQFEIAGLGPEIPEQTLQRILVAFLTACQGGYGVLTGSVQLRDEHFYAKQVEAIRERGGRAIVDAEGLLLRNAVEAGPFLIKPNVYELEQLTGASISGVDDAARQARELQRRGVANVCVSLGPEGAVFVDADHCYHARPPKVKVDSTVGAGDSMVGALTAGFRSGYPVKETLRLAVACSAGTVTRPGTELFDPEQLEALKRDVTIEKLDI